MASPPNRTFERVGEARVAFETPVGMVFGQAADHSIVGFDPDSRSVQLLLWVDSINAGLFLSMETPAARILHERLGDAIAKIDAVPRPRDGIDEK